MQTWIHLKQGSLAEFLHAGYGASNSLVFHGFSSKYPEHDKADYSDHTTVCSLDEEKRNCFEMKQEQRLEKTDLDLNLVERSASHACGFLHP